MKKFRITLERLACLLVFTQQGFGQEITEAGKALEVKVETVLTGLYNPCGISVRPATGGEFTQLFIADSGGLHIIRMVTGKPGETTEIITGFPQSTYGKDPTYNIGPLGLAFLSKNTLLVGGGGLNDGEELLRVYNIPVTSTGLPLSANAMDYSVGPIPAGEDSIRGEGNFFAIAVPPSRDAVYVTSSGDDTKGWVLRASVTKGKLEKLKPFIQTKTATGVRAPRGITFSPTKHLLISQMGEINETNDSLVAFYNPSDGRLKLKMKTQLHDIQSVAYSPSRLPSERQLFALDSAWKEPHSGGLFRIEAKNPTDRTEGCNAVKLVALDKPSAMAFAPDGALYVTTFGVALEGSETHPGKLYKITGNFTTKIKKGSKK